MRAKYITVKIPEELADKLDEFVADMGYRSRAEIVNDAIRRFIDERKVLDKTIPSEEKVETRRDPSNANFSKFRQPIVLRQ
jgi:metal-responsive CopG/Arc/MetJ family transcriptional regulator